MPGPALVDEHAHASFLGSALVYTTPISSICCGTRRFGPRNCWPKPRQMPSGMAYMVMAHIVRAYTVRPSEGRCPYSYGLYSYGLYSYGIYSFGIYSSPKRRQTLSGVSHVDAISLYASVNVSCLCMHVLWSISQSMTSMPHAIIHDDVHTGLMSALERLCSYGLYCCGLYRYDLHFWPI